MATFHALSVKDKVQETSDAVSLILEVPAEIKEKFDYKPGQYLSFRFMLNGEELRREYSLSSNPGKDEFLRVTAKRVENGRVSNHIADKVMAGDQLEVQEPAGSFVFNNPQAGEYHLFAAGSGITPIFSILNAIRMHEPQAKVNLYYGNRNEESIIFKKQIDELEAASGGQLSVTHILSRVKPKGISGLFKKAKVADGQVAGRLDAVRIGELLNDHVKDISKAHFYVCGPSVMMDTLQEALINRGVDQIRIHLERFETVKPQASAEGSNAAVVKGVFDGQNIEIQVAEGKTILESAISQNIDIPYSCQGGVCSSCRCKLVKGKVEMGEVFGLTDAEKEQGYILTCMSYPKEAELELDWEY